MKKYEFYIYSEAGEDVWCWDLNQTNKVIKDIKGLSNDDTFSVEVLRYTNEENCDFTEIYPLNQSKDLPKYVQKAVNKVLKEVE